MARIYTGNIAIYTSAFEVSKQLWSDSSVSSANKNCLLIFLSVLLSRIEYTKCDPLRSIIPWRDVSVCLPRACALEKRLNWSRSCLQCRYLGSKKHWIRWKSDPRTARRTEGFDAAVAKWLWPLVRYRLDFYFGIWSCWVVCGSDTSQVKSMIMSRQR